MNRKVRALLVLMLAVGLLITGCGGSTDDSRSSGTTTKVTVTAKVVDSEREEIITDAEVKMDGKEGEGKEGVYQFKAEANKEHTFTVNAPDYVKTEKTVKVKEEDMTVKIKLAKQDKVLNGTVMNKNEEPIKGVTVTVKDTEKSKTTGENGKFKFEDLEEGKYTLVFEHKLYKIKEKQIEFEFDKDNNLNISLEPKPAEISGVVTDQDERVLTGIIVKLTKPDAEEVISKQYSNGVEGFSFDNLNPGEYIVKFRHVDYKDKDITVKLGPNAHKELDPVKLTKIPGKIVGSIPEGATVRIMETGQEATATNFEFTGLGQGEYTVAVIKSGYHPKVFQREIESPGDIKEIIVGSLTEAPKVEGEEGLTKHAQVEQSYSEEGEEKYISLSSFEKLYKINGRIYRDAAGYGGPRIYYYDDNKERIETILGAGTGGEHLKIEKRTTITPSDIPSAAEYIKLKANMGSLEEGSYLTAEAWLFCDNRSPIISADKKHGYKDLFSIDVDIIDNGAGVEKARYKITNSLSRVSFEEMESSINDGKASIDISGNSLNYYLHVRAKDKMGNETYRIFGPYVIK